jgi:hypothetical protein
LGRASGHFDIVEMLRLLSLVGEGTALARHVANLATTETASSFGKVGLVLWGELTGKSGGVGTISEACKIVDLGAEVVNGDMKIVNVHGTGIVLGGGVI